MASIVVAGDTSGAITLAAPAIAGTNTLTLPANTGTVITTASSGQSIPSAALPAGSVLQVVNATYSVLTSNSTQTFADTGLTATITPKFATSKILILVNQEGCRKEAGNALNRVQLLLKRDSTDILNFSYGGGYTAVSDVNSFGTSGCNYLDSPATTSAITYKTQLRNGVNAASVSVQTDTETSTITLMEIAG
jgi:hypothetical protein